MEVHRDRPKRGGGRSERNLRAAGLDGDGAGLLLGVLVLLVRQPLLVGAVPVVVVECVAVAWILGLAKSEGVLLVVGVLLVGEGRLL